MRPDLAHAIASVEWAESNLPAFSVKIDAWFGDNVYADTIDLSGDTANQLVVAIEKELLPLNFVVEAGAYINAIRSSLDILASALARRFGIDGAEQLQFPIAKDFGAYRSGRFKGSEFVKALPDRERGIIEGLEPYHGGNEQLWILHQLDIIRKHRRLLSIYISPRMLTFHGPVGFAFKPLPFIPPAADDKTPLGFLPYSNAKHKITVTGHISFDEGLLGVRKPVIATLQQLAAYTKAIIEAFDTP